jgi:hypothetical protein
MDRRIGKTTRHDVILLSSISEIHITMSGEENNFKAFDVR